METLYTVIRDYDVDFVLDFTEASELPLSVY